MSVAYPQFALTIPTNKEPMASLPILQPDAIPQVLLPFVFDGAQTHTPVLNEYDTVLRGQPVADATTKNGAPLFSSVTGIFTGTREVKHPLYGKLRCMVIDCLTLDQTIPPMAEDMYALSDEELLARCRVAGIIDELDGTPLADKLETARGQALDILFADAAETEPYACSAWGVLHTDGRGVLDGLSLAARIADIPQYRIAVSLSNKRYNTLKKSLGKTALTRVSPDRYPVDSLSKQPHLRIGVQACLALARAVTVGEPPMDGVVTVAGDAVSLPCNVRVPYGTPIREVLKLTGLVDEPEFLVLGDSLTGLPTTDFDLPILPETTCLLAFLPQKELPVHTCIGCGRCAAVCHKHLLPYEIARRVENLQFEQLRRLVPEECDGCNACTVVCPANRPVAERVAEAMTETNVISWDWGRNNET